MLDLFAPHSCCTFMLDLFAPHSCCTFMLDLFAPHRKGNVVTEMSRWKSLQVDQGNQDANANLPPGQHRPTTNKSENSQITAALATLI